MTAKQKKMTREEQALSEVGQTDIGPRTAWTMVLVFLALISLVPLTDAVLQWRRGGVAEMRVLDLFRRPPRISEFTFPIHREAVAEKNPLHEYERSVEDASLIRSACQPRLQELLTRWLHTGNSKVVLGVDDWLFYRPGVDYPAYPGFLSGSQHQILRRLHADPRPAIIAFHHACRAAGVRLVLLPIADKSQIHPEKITARIAGNQNLENPDFPQWLEELHQQGIEVIPTAPLMHDIARQGPAFLRQDTHWTPETMTQVASAVADFLALPPAQFPRAWTSEPLEVSRVGDLVDTLKMPAGQTLYRPQTVRIERVLDATSRAPWQTSPDAEVLLLGDSFTNIFTVEKMGWGSAAGLAPQLALRLGRDLDVIAMNGGGASQVRQELAQRPAPLAGKKVLIWAFSARDLAVAEWLTVPMEGGTVVTASASGERTCLLEVLAISTVRPPDAADYPDALSTILARVIPADGATAEHIRLVVDCMKDFELLPAARLRPGDRLEATLQPFTGSEVHRYNDLPSDGSAVWKAKEWKPR